jgi:predicted MFS family arabinose efflux permease
MQPGVGLAAVNFFLADVQGGIGPFLATWLAQAAHWDPARVGLVITVSGLIGLVCNTPAGALVDRLEWPRFWVAASALATVAGTLTLLPARSFAAVLAAQLVVAGGGALMAPALMALTLALVGKAQFAAQQSRNQAWNHTGNVAAAGLVAVATFQLGGQAAFWVLAGMAAASGLALALIQAASIDPDRAKGHVEAAADASLFEVLADRRLLALGIALLLFHLGNAAMLPLLGQRMAAIGQGDATRWLAACVIVAQVTMVPMAITAGRAADRINPAWLLVAACGVLPVRGVLAALAQHPALLVPIQILDACGAGTLGVVVPILIADYTWGSGRTQTALGAVATLQGIGAALSTTLGGMLATWVGWEAAFIGLTVPAVFALALVAGNLARGVGAVEVR